MSFTFAAAREVHGWAVALWHECSLNHIGSDLQVLPCKAGVLLCLCTAENSCLCNAVVCVLSVRAMDQALTDLVRADCVANQRGVPFGNRVLALLE